MFILALSYIKTHEVIFSSQGYVVCRIYIDIYIWKLCASRCAFDERVSLRGRRVLTPFL
jgi:hypothetical protein